MPSDDGATILEHLTSCESYSVPNRCVELIANSRDSSLSRRSTNRVKALYTGLCRMVDLGSKPAADAAIIIDFTLPAVPVPVSCGIDLVAVEQKRQLLADSVTG